MSSLKYLFYTIILSERQTALLTLVLKCTVDYQCLCWVLQTFFNYQNLLRCILYAHKYGTWNAVSRPHLCFMLILFTHILTEISKHSFYVWIQSFCLSSCKFDIVFLLVLLTFYEITNLITRKVYRGWGHIPDDTPMTVLMYYLVS